MKFIFGLMSLLFLSACQRRGLPVQPMEPSNAVAEAPKIAFFQIKVIEKEQHYEAKIVQQQAVLGILDRPINRPQVAENQWLISFLDGKKKVLEEVILKNPLNRYLEFADDNGVFKSYSVKKQEETFFFRVQQHPAFAMLRVEQILPNQQKKQLFTIRL